MNSGKTKDASSNKSPRNKKIQNNSEAEEGDNRGYSGNIFKLINTIYKEYEEELKQKEQDSPDKENNEDSPFRRMKEEQELKKKKAMSNINQEIKLVLFGDEKKKKTDDKAKLSKPLSDEEKKYDNKVRKILLENMQVTDIDSLLKKSLILK